MWRWGRWLVLMGLIMLVLLMVFHRPLILWALNRYAPDAVKSLPMKLAWHVDGSLWHDLSISTVAASSDAESMPLRSLTVGRLEVKHDWSAAWRGDYLNIARSVTLHDADAVIDLRHPSPASPNNDKPADRQALIDILKKIGWPDIDLRNVNVTVLQPEGSLEIKGLDLRLPPGKEGTLRIASVSHPALAKYPLREVTAKLSIAGAKLNISELKLPPQVEVEHLQADADHLGKGRLAVSTRVRSGAATIEVNAEADLTNDHPEIDATIDVTGLDDKEVARWVPDMPRAQANVSKLHIVAKGDPLQPRRLDASVSMELRELAYQAFRAESMHLQASLAGGHLALPELSVSAGGNRLQINTEADAPEEWSGFARTPLKLEWKLGAPRLEAIAGMPVKLRGRLEGDGRVEVSDRGLQHFAANLKGGELGLDEHGVRSLDARVDGDLKAMQFSTKAVAEAGDGQLDAEGEIGLDAGRQSRAKWQIEVPRPAELAGAAGVSWPAGLGAGVLRLDGAIEFDLAELKESRFDRAKGGGTVLVKELSWKQAPCEQVAAAWKLETGTATISSLDASLPGNNTVHVEGTMALAGEQEFAAKTSVLLKDVASLRAWLDAANVKQLQSGSITLNWQGQGRVKGGFKVAGTASLDVEALRYETLPDAAALQARFTHDLDGADFSQLRAALGPWSASFTGKAGRTLIDLSNLEVFHESTKLIGGEVRVPLDLQATPVPVNPDQELHVRLESNGNLALSEVFALARQPLPSELSGAVNASLRVDGRLPDPAARVEVTAVDLHLPQAPSKEPGKVAVLLTLGKGLLQAGVSVDVRPLEPLTAGLEAQVDAMALIKEAQRAQETPFTASVKLNQPSLDFLKPMVPMLDELRGAVVVDIKADGTMATPHVHGTIDIDVPSLVPHDPDLPLVKDFRVRLAGEDTTVRLTSLHGMVAGGELDLSGSCDLKDMKAPAFDLTLKARDLLATRNQMMTLRTDADLHCKGVPSAASLTGSVELTRGRFFQEVNFLPLNKLMNDLPPLPDAKTEKAGRGDGGNASPLPPMLKDWTFDLAVKTKDDIRLLGNIVNGGVQIDLKAGGSGAAPVVTGEVRTNRAVLNLPFSTLRIRNGIVRFTPDTPLLAPSLEMLAESTVDAYEIDLRGYGAVTDPKLHFSSTPPLAEGEIATLLATGTTTSGLKKAGDDTAGRALLFLVREAYRRMFISKNSKPAKPGEKEDDSRFIVQERSEDGKLGGVTGIYEFSRKMKITGSTDKDGGFRAMFHYLFRFK